jgi:hypothetical protein
MPASLQSLEIKRHFLSLDNSFETINFYRKENKRREWLFATVVSHFYQIQKIPN